MTQQPNPDSPQVPAGFWIPENPTPGSGLRPVRGLATAATIAAIALTAIEMLEAAFAWSAQKTYLDAAANGASALDVWTAYDTMAVPLVIAAIAAYVVTCLWLFQARENAEILRPGSTHARKIGWVWAGWLVPLACIWVPFQILRDVQGKPAYPKPTGPLLRWWWAFWLLGVFSSQIGTRLIGFGEIDPDIVQALGAVETVNAGITFVALALWLTLIRNITQDQERAIDASRQPAASQA